MKIEEIKNLYKDEWVVAEVLSEDKIGHPIDLKVIGHGKTRSEAYEIMKLPENKNRYLYHFYTGQILEKGYAVAFYVKL